MSDEDDVYEAKGNVCRFQVTDNGAENIVEKSRFMSNSECIIEELREGCSQDSCRTRARRTRFVSREVSVTCGEPNVLELDEFTEELFKFVDFPVCGVFLRCLASRGTSKTVLFSVAWPNAERSRQCCFPCFFLLSLPPLLGHTLNEQYRVELPVFESSSIVVSMVRSVAQHTLRSSDVHSIRTEDIFALEELSFNETRRAKNSRPRRCATPVDSVLS